MLWLKKFGIHRCRITNINNDNMKALISIKNTPVLLINDNCDYSYRSEFTGLAIAARIA